jgi:hypothetical protein
MEMPSFPEEMPEELKTMIREAVNTQITVSMSLVEVAIMARSLDELMGSITKEMNGSDPKQVGVLAQMLADVAVIKNRLATAGNARLSEMGGGLEL